MIRGIDVSFYDHRYEGIDWAKTGMSWDFVFIKCFEYQEDIHFKTQWSRSRGNINRGAYYFWRQRPDKKSIASTTDAFLRTIDNYDGELPVVLDLEDTNATRITAFGQIDTLSEIIKRETGRYPIIYSNLSYWKEIGGEQVSSHWAGVHPFWLAYPAYDNSAYFDTYYRAVLEGRRKVFVPTPPKPYKSIDFIQWTFRGKPEDVAGYPTGPLAKKVIDFNIYLGEDFGKLLNKPATLPIPETELTMEEKVEILWKEYLQRMV